MSKIFSTNQVRNPMDRIVSAYRNKLECRAGKEYYYKVNRYYHKKNNIVIRKTILNWISKSFPANCLLCSRAPDSEESFAGAWQKSCSELQKSWQTQIRRGKVATKIQKLCFWNISWQIKGTKRCETRIKTVTQRYLIYLICWKTLPRGGGAEFLGVCSVRACSSYRRPPLETFHSGLWERPRRAYIFVPDDLRVLGLSLLQKFHIINLLNLQTG